MAKRRGRDAVVVTAAAIGAIAGLRSMAAPAMLTQELSEHGGGKHLIDRVLASEGGARLLTLLASGEMLADKSSAMGPRTAAVPLIGRAVVGSLTAAAYASHRRHAVLIPAVVGAAAAIASTFAAFHARRFAGEQLNLPDRLLGMMEDALVVAASRGVAHAIGEAE